jgi:hypothetical protein
MRSLLYNVLFLPSVGASSSVSSECNPHARIHAPQIRIPSDLGFDEARMDQYAQYSGTHAQAKSKLNPATIVHCTEEEHVQSAVRFAAACGYKVTVRSGGHSYTGSSSCNFERCMQLDLSGMNSTSVEDRLMTTGPGIRLKEFADFSLKHFLSVPHGGCSKVGMGGHLQSSAWGMMSHSHGSGLDHVVSFRMVLADGGIIQVNRDDANSTIYKSVLGSAPGSWGVITQYTLEGVRDAAVPWTRMITIRILWTRANFVASMRQMQFVSKDQEERNLRDMKLILVASPPTEAADTEVFITICGLWTGIDSGPMTKHWRDKYLQPFRDLEHQGFPTSVDLPSTLSAATRLFANLWTNHNDRYAVHSYHSDHWWSDEFIDVMATEMDERVAMIPDVYPSFQFLPLGSNTQWARNAGMNALTWRDARAYVDDWMFVKNESRYEEIAARMRNFSERTRHFWQYTDGSERSTWMSPSTVYPNSTDLRNETIARKFFPNSADFERLKLLKAELDPQDLFSNVGTIPLPDVARREHWSYDGSRHVPPIVV